MTDGLDSLCLQADVILQIARLHKEEGLTKEALRGRLESICFSG